MYRHSMPTLAIGGAYAWRAIVAATAWTCATTAALPSADAVAKDMNAKKASLTPRLSACCTARVAAAPTCAVIARTAAVVVVPDKMAAKVRSTGSTISVTAACLCMQRTS